MSRYRFFGEERDCYDEGRRDEEYGRPEYSHNRYSSCPCDEAYFEGRRDERREEERRAEDRAEEEAAERRAHQRHMEGLAEEQEYYDSLQCPPEPEPPYPEDPNA